MADTNIDALKGLWAAIKNDGSTAADCAADTIPAVIDAITVAYSGGSTQELGTLTVQSFEGTEVGKTQITVSGQGSGSLVYQTNNTALPEYGEDLTSWTAWNGTDEITAANSSYLAVCEIDANTKAVAGGRTMVNTLIE